jgi:predicted DNA-binding transcriptional regulator YafY
MHFAGGSLVAKFKPQHTRLLFIDRKLREGGFPNCSTLAREWEVSAKTIQRDLEYMREQLDAPLAYSTRKKGYYYQEEQYQLPALAIRQSDLFALYLAEKLLDQYEGTPIHPQLVTVFRKIEAALPDKINLDSNAEQSRFTIFPPVSTTIHGDIWETVIQGLRNGQRLDIQYRRPGGTPERRSIDPYHAVRFEGDWYVVAHCHLRGAIRTFSLARIQRARLRAQRFTIPSDFNFQRLTHSHFGVHWGEGRTTVRIRFTAAVADLVRERAWHPSQELRALPDGGLEMRLAVSHLLELKRWILSWGDQATVLAPDTFVADLAATVHSMQAQYPTAPRH